MKTDLFIYNNGDVFLFKKPPQHNNYQISDLKDFICFLKFMGRYPVSFGHVPPHPQFLPEMSFLDNMLLDSVSETLFSSKEDVFRETIKNANNPFLRPIFDCIPFSSDIQLKDLNAEQQKLAVLLKAFVHAPPFLFLESPDLHLQHASLELVSKAIEHIALTGVTMVFIATDSPARWDHLVTKIIARNEKNEFRISPMPSNVPSPSLQPALVFHQSPLLKKID